MPSKSKPKPTRKKESVKIIDNKYTEEELQPRICSPNMLIEQIWNEPGSTLSLRNQQMKVIKTEINKMAQQQDAIKTRGLLILGPPGSGKTTCIRFLIRHQFNQQYQALFINSHITWKYAELISKIKQQQASASKKLLVCIQQIDYIFENNRNSLDSLRELMDLFVVIAQKKTILLGLTNIMNLGQQIHQQTGYRLIQVLFAPYGECQLSKIIEGKVKVVEQFAHRIVEMPRNLVNFLSNKMISERRGDIRILMQFLKILFLPYLLTHGKNPNDESIVVSIQMISALMNKIQNKKQSLFTKIPLKTQIILLALYLYIKRTEALEVSLKQLAKQIKKIYTQIQLSPTDEIYESIEDLNNYGFISIRNKGSKSRKIVLRTSLDELEEALSTNTMLKNFLSSSQHTKIS